MNPYRTLLRFILALAVIGLISQTYHTLTLLKALMADISTVNFIVSPLFYFGSIELWFHGSPYSNPAWPHLLITVICLIGLKKNAIRKL